MSAQVGTWLPLRLRLLAVADAREQFARWLAGSHEMTDNAESWADMVADFAEWEVRGGYTSDFMRTLFDGGAQSGAWRIGARMAVVWFAEARRLEREGL